MDSNSELKQIGQRIRAARTAQNLTQADLAFAIEVSDPYISDIELGKTKMNILTFCRIVETLKMSADSILRPNVPVVNQIYQQEFADLLKDCSPQEIESILKIVKEIKASLHSKKED